MDSIPPSAPAPVRLGVRSIQLYQLADRLSGLILLGMLVVAPWWFGTTQPPVIRGMNWGGAALVLLLAFKWGLRWRTGYCPPRWDAAAGPGARGIIRALGIITVLILAYMLVSALNPRATYDPFTATFHYRDALGWLPHSYDPAATWQVLANYTALAGVFWALRDWLAGLTDAEVRARRQVFVLTEEGAAGAGDFLPARLRLLLWVLCLNGGLLAAQGIAQRLSGGGKLLWLVEPRINKEAIAQFGPFAYRANAAQYLNLIWPVALGFWWTRQRRQPDRWRHHVLLAAAALMAAAAFITTARGGALIAAGMLGAAACWFAAVAWIFPDGPASRRGRGRSAPALGLFFLAVGLLVRNVGWNDLGERMDQINEGLDGREQIYAAGRQMARDYRWWGTGPGSFHALYALYRTSPEDYWPAQLHNDWLEFRITFGRIGFGLLLSAVGLVLARAAAAGGIFAGRRMTGMIWLAALGVLVHARFDFPLLIYSILMLVVSYGAVLSLVGAPPER